jgi:hypothetical protein
MLYEDFQCPLFYSVLMVPDHLSVVQKFLSCYQRKKLYSIRVQSNQHVNGGVIMKFKAKKVEEVSLTGANAWG